MNEKIRQATASDLDAVVELVNAAYEKYFPRIHGKPMQQLLRGKLNERGLTN